MSSWSSLAASLWRSFCDSWNTLWFRNSPPHLLAVFRIAFGGFLLFYFGLMAPHVAMLFSRESLQLPSITGTSPLAILLTPPPAWAAQIVFCSFLASLATFTAGAMTRVSAIVAFVLYVYYWNLQLHLFGTSFERLFLSILFVLIWSGCGRTLSVDMRVAKGSWFAWEPISILPQRIIAVQIAATYLGVGWQKMVLSDWQSGEVLAWGFTGRWATPLAWWVARLNLPMWVWDLQVHTVKYFEFAIPFGLWIPRWQWLFFLGGAVFHTVITVFLGIWWFMVLIPAYIVYLRPEDVHAFLQRVSHRRIA